MTAIRHLCTLIMLCFAIGAGAQKSSEALQTYTKAEAEYDIGHFHEADSILSANMSSYSTTLKASAYRLRALCSLLEGDNEAAKEHTQQMFRMNPYYTPSAFDPVRFVDLVEELKHGGVKVSTASQQAETLDEVPVPVTLITEDMINASGARTLQELLLIYVPGMSLVEGPDANMAMHGVYSASQEKILIMLDGHRLNSRVTNAEAPDYRTSLDKIKQIEVLRGPASSLYGNVALTAVVNIITKKGHDIDGIKISGGIGSNNSYRADLLMGKEGVDMGYSLWASIYTSDGERRDISTNDNLFYGILPVPGYMYINGYNNMPSYDVGFTGQYKNFSFMANTQCSKRVTPYLQLLFPSLYNYDEYRSIDGVKPGRNRRSTHLELSYENSWDKLSIKATAFADMEDNTFYDVIADTLRSVSDAQVSQSAAGEMIDSLMNELLIHRGITKYLSGYTEEQIAQLKYKAVDALVVKRGLYQAQSWKDYTFGGSIQLSYAYKWGNISGTLLGGIQAENNKMQYNSLLFGDDYTHVLVTFAEGTHTLVIGNEYVISPFMQLKSYLTDRLIFNGGIRYDHKRRYNDKNLDALSPRVSLIYRLSGDMNVKLGYAHSFVDAPYFYRANKLGTYPGGENLEAESMDAVMLDFGWNIPHTGLSYEANVYYNGLSDLIYYDTKTNIYTNAGHMKLLGIENSLSYAAKRSLATLNVSYQRVVSSSDANVSGHSVNNVPDLIANAMYRYRLYDGRAGRVYLRGNATFYSSQPSPIVGSTVYNSAGQVYLPDNSTDARIIANCGADYSFGGATLSLSLYNIFGTDYVQGGNSNVPMPQEGRSIMAKLSYKL